MCDYIFRGSGLCCDVMMSNAVLSAVCGEVMSVEHDYELQVPSNDVLSESVVMVTYMYM